MRRMYYGFAVLLLGLLLAACGRIGAPQPEVQQPQPRESIRSAFPVEQGSSPSPNLPTRIDTPPQSLWFVEFESEPLVSGGSLSTLSNERGAFGVAASNIGLDYEERYRFERIFNGISVRIAPQDLVKLANLPGVKAIYPVTAIPIPEVTPSTEPQIANAKGMTGADIARNELGLTGRGIRVGVIDSGLDTEHPDFAPNRIVAGFGFVHDDFNASDPERDVPIPSENFDDCNGHGTHVAGIVGADGVVVGVAPKVGFGIYRVFGCEGSTTSDIVMAATERALADNMDVVNLSLGSAFSWPRSAEDRVADAGVVVVASIGNSGVEGLYATGAPGVNEGVIGVASYDNVILAFEILRLEDDTPIPYVNAAGFLTSPSGVTPEVVYVGRGCNDDPYEDDPSGKVALIARGACTFNEKYQRAFNEGAVGIVVHNINPGEAPFAMGGIEDQGIFAVMISLENGLLIRERLDAGEDVTLNFTGETREEPNPTGGLISSFSSWGLSPTLTLKPDLGAPGGAIQSTYPLELGGYATLSGTSMSSPHVAGGVALMLEYRHDQGLRTTVPLVRTLLQNSANPAEWSLCANFGVCGFGILDAVHRQGAGMLDIPGSALATTQVVPSRLSLGESQQGAFFETLTIRNTGSEEISYDLSNYDLTIGTPGFAENFGFVLPETLVSFSESSVTVPANGVATVSVTISPDPEAPDTTIYGGYIELSPRDGEGDTLRVPYSGFKGDYQSLPVYRFPPFMVKEDSIVYEDGVTYTMRDGDFPTFGFSLFHHLQSLSVEVVPVGDRGWIGAQPAFTIRELDRNSVPGGPFPFYVFSIEDFDTTGLPDGQYYLRVTAVKALGDVSNPDHVEVRDSPIFVIDRTD